LPHDATPCRRPSVRIHRNVPKHVAHERIGLVVDEQYLMATSEVRSLAEVAALPHHVALPKAMHGLLKIFQMTQVRFRQLLPEHDSQLSALGRVSWGSCAPSAKGKHGDLWS